MPIVLSFWFLAFASIFPGIPATPTTPWGLLAISTASFASSPQPLCLLHRQPYGDSCLRQTRRNNRVTPGIDTARFRTAYPCPVLLVTGCYCQGVCSKPLPEAPAVDKQRQICFCHHRKSRGFNTGCIPSPATSIYASYLLSPIRLLLGVK